MTRMLFALLTAMLLALTLAAPAFATHDPAHVGGPPVPFAHPFCGSGEEYAHGHIVALAQEQGLGPAHGHTPGWHQGFAVCDPAGKF
jgi:hypothetical protein